MNLSTFLLRGLRAEKCDFFGENRSGTGALSKHGFHPCPSIVRNSQRRNQTPAGHLVIFWVGMCRPGLQIGTPF